MYRSLKLHPVAIAAALSLSLNAQASLLHLVPEHSDIVISVSDVSDLRDRSQNNPFMQAWSDPVFMEWLAPLRERLDWGKFNDSMKEESGKSFDEVVDMVEGGLLVSFHGLAQGRIDAWAKNPNVLLLIEVGAQEAAFRTFVEDDLKGNEEPDKLREVNREDYGDAVIVEVASTGAEDDAVEPDTDRIFWSVYDGLFVLSPHRETVLNALDARRNGGAESPFDQGRHYGQIEARSSDHGLLFYLNGRSLYQAIVSDMEAKSAAQPPNPMGISPAAVLPALGLDRWEMLYFTAQVDADQTIGHYGVTHNGSPTGLWNMLLANTNRFPRPSWLPEGWHTASTMRFDMANAVNELENMAAQISPMAIGMWQGIQMQVQQSMGIDLKNGLFNTFGDEIVFAQFFEGDPGIDFAAVPFGQSPQLIAIKLRDAATFRNTFNTALETALQSIKPFMEVRDYLGQEMMVFTLPNPAAPGTSQTSALAISDDTLFLSMFAAAPLEQVLQAIASPGSGTFWDRQDVQTSMAWIPGDATSYGLQNSAAMMNQLVKTITELSVMQAQMAAEEEELVDESGNPLPTPANAFNHEAAPDLASLRTLFGPIISYNVIDGDGMHGEARLQHVTR